MSKAQKIQPDESGLFWEARVAEALGVPRKLLARLRNAYLQVDVDFARRANNAVALTAQGLATIERLLAEGAEPDAGQPAGKPKETGGKPPASDIPAGPPKREKMLVERVRPGGQLLLCVAHKRPAPIAIVVRVRENDNFAPDMEIEAIESGDGVWQFRNRAHGDESTVGRLPRRKGVW